MPENSRRYPYDNNRPSEDELRKRYGANWAPTGEALPTDERYFLQPHIPRVVPPSNYPPVRSQSPQPYYDYGARYDHERDLNRYRGPLKKPRRGLAALGKGALLFRDAVTDRKPVAIATLAAITLFGGMVAQNTAEEVSQLVQVQIARSRQEHPAPQPQPIMPQDNLEQGY